MDAGCCRRLDPSYVRSNRRFGSQLYDHQLDRPRLGTATRSSRLGNCPPRCRHCSRLLAQVFGHGWMEADMAALKPIDLWFESAAVNGGTEHRVILENLPPSLPGPSQTIYWRAEGVPNLPL